MPVLEFDSGDKVGVEVEVTEVGPRLYRVEEITTLLFGPEDDSDESLAALPNYRDVIYVEPSESGSLRFVRVHERGGFVQRTLVLPRPMVESPARNELLGLAHKFGGTSVLEMGGVFTYAVPEAELDAFFEAFERMSSEA